MKTVDPSDYPQCTFGSNVQISGENVVLRAGAVFGDNVRIEAETIEIGFDAVVERNTTVRGLGQKMKRFILGDNTFIGFANQILTSDFVMMDYSQLHNSGLHSGYQPLTIGYNCWIGQNTILNCTEELSIGNNVRIGTQSQLWTHVASGELLEGCTLYGNKPLVLRDNVWIVGGAVISPGLVLERNSIIMTGSVLTKSTEAFHTYGGVPAQDVTQKLNFWKDMSLDDKFAMIRKFADEFLEANPRYHDQIVFAENAEAIGEDTAGKLIIVKDAGDMGRLAGLGQSIFDLSAKQYIKTRSRIEIDWIRFCVGFRARFIPYEQQ